MKLYYDDEFDILEIFFLEPEPTLTVELQDDVYVHIVPESRQVIGLTTHHFRGHHTEFVFPFHGILTPTSPQVAQDIAKALLPADMSRQRACPKGSPLDGYKQASNQGPSWGVRHGRIAV
jgi:uncharacterized protein YuzE